jgi:hypothetical protein
VGAQELSERAAVGCGNASCREGGAGCQGRCGQFASVAVVRVGRQNRWWWVQPAEKLCPWEGRMQSTVAVASPRVRPNPSLERRPREACHPWAAQASRRLHYPARPKGGPPHGSPQLER